MNCLAACPTGRAAFSADNALSAHVPRGVAPRLNEMCRHDSRGTSLSTTMFPMFRDAVAAGDGALHTFTTRSVS